jgi:DNA-directed RNA polymerase specialized sigma24 family protein
MPPRHHLKKRYLEPSTPTRTPTREEWAVALASLPERQREVVVLLLGGLSQQEAAQRLGITRQAVTARLERARATALAHLVEMLRGSDPSPSCKARTDVPP